MFGQPHHYPFRRALAEMEPYVPGEQPQGGKFVKLNTNENPYPAAQAVVEAICSAATTGLERYPDPYANAFRNRAAEVLGLPGPDWIMAGNGSDEILTILVRALVGEGQRLRMPYPSYILYATLADIQGALWERLEFDKNWRLPAAFADECDDLRLVFLPNPNSPSGTVEPPEKVLQLAEQLPCPLVIDEAYADFAEANCLSLVQQNENIFVTRSLSKSYALAGLRFGFVVAQPHRIAELMKIKDSYNCDTLSIAAATAAVGSTQWLQENVARIRATRTRMEARLKQLGFRVTPSQANFVWCEHHESSHKQIYQTLKRQQILVRYMNFPAWGDGLRISVGTDQQVDACMLLLEQCV